MAEETTGSAAAASSPPARLGGWPAIRRLVTLTVGACFRYRVTGLAAEAAFFAILSLPPLVFGLVASIGYIANIFDVQTVASVERELLRLAAQVLTQQSVDEVIQPTIEDVTRQGRFEIVSIGFVLALWSGSRALNVFIDTITIMYGLAGKRGIVKTRAISFALYVVTLIVGTVLLPLVLLGPEFVDAVVPDQVHFLASLYWPIVVGLSVVSLTTLYQRSVPVRKKWRSEIPGAAFALLAWVGGSYLLRWVLSESTGSTSIYGPLAAPLAVLLWLYLIAIAVLVGAAINAAWATVWPGSSEMRPRKQEGGM